MNKPQLFQDLLKSVNEKSNVNIKDNSVIYVSGMLGAGKTTVATLLAQKLGFKLIPEFLEEVPEWVYLTRDSYTFEEKIKANLWTLHQHVKKDQIIRENNGNCVVDRTWLDSLIYSVNFGDEVLQNMATHTEKHTWLPGKYVLLIVDPQTCKKRLMERMKFSEAGWKTQWGPYVQSLYDVVRIFKKVDDLVVINTTNVTPEETVELIIEKSTAKFGL